MIRSAVLTLILIVLLAPAPAGLAQDDPAPEGPPIIVCAEGGCRYAKMSGEFTEQDLTDVLGEENPYGDNGYMLCPPTGGCEWTEMEPADADLLYGGDGEVEMIFEDEEVEPITDDTPIDPDVEFEFEDIEARDVTPLAGEWTAYHQAGQMVCPGAITIDVPAGDIQTSTLVVSDDGDSLTFENLDPELTAVPMERVAPGTYHGELEVTAEGETMILNFDEKFVDPVIGLGLISAELNAGGYECTLERRFYVIYGGEDGFTFAEGEPGADK